MRSGYKILKLISLYNKCSTQSTLHRYLCDCGTYCSDIYQLDRKVRWKTLLSIWNKLDR